MQKMPKALTLKPISIIILITVALPLSRRAWHYLMRVAFGSSHVQSVRYLN